MSEKENLLASHPPQTQEEYPEATYPNGPPPVYTATADSSQKVIFVQPSTAYVTAAPPPDYLYLSLFSIILCCWPIGLVALVKSIEARRHIQEGRTNLAYVASRQARQYNKIAIIVGIIAHVVGWILIIGGTASRIVLESQSGYEPQN